jgi:hypothetical protein
MWSAANTLSRTGKAWDRARTAAMFRARAETVAGEAQAGKAEDRTEGLAERSVNTSIVPPTQGTSAHQTKDDLSAGDRYLTENDQRKGMEKTDPGSPKADGRAKP